MNSPVEKNATLSLNIGNREYNVPLSKEIAPLVEQSLNNKPIVLGAVVRGLTIKALIENQFSLWTCFCLDVIEPEMLDWIDSMPEGSAMYDLGASTGPFSIYAAAKGMKVFSFEPEAQNYSLLEMNHHLNRDIIKYPITALNIAISNEHKIEKMYCADYLKGAHDKILGKPQRGQVKEEFIPQHVQSVMTYSLDGITKYMKLPKPEYLKIDVDGAEEKVIAGANKILKSPELKEIFIDLKETDEDLQLIKRIEGYGFKVKSKHQVEDYNGLFNWIFVRNK